ncbi:hypothetical protein GCM10027577_25110 [Spirosoma fluminis]
MKALEFFGKNIYRSVNEQNSLFPKNILLDKNYVYQKSLYNRLYIHLIFDESFDKQPSQLSLFGNALDYQHFRLKSEEGNYYYEHWFSGEQSINANSFYGREYTMSKSYIDLYFKQVEVFTINPYLVTRPYPLFPNSERIKSDTSNLVAYLDTLRDKYPDIFRQIESDINLLIPEFSQIRFDNVAPDKELKKNYGDKTYKKFGLYNDNQNEIYWSEELSEGTVYFLILLCIIHQPQPPKLLLLEEPERGIHPRRIREVMDFIFRLAEEKNIQIILTTHNENVLNEFTSMPEAVFVFEKDEDGATRVKNLLRDIIEPSNQRSRETGTKEIDFTSNLGENWMYGLLGGVPEEAL